MSNIIHDEIMALAAEFAAQRRSVKNRRFPETIWKSAVTLAQKSSISQVSQAIKVSSAYLKRKMSLLAHSDSEVTFVELIPPKHHSSHIVTINFESFSGHKMMIDGIDSSAVVPLLAEFLKNGGHPCCK